MDKIKKWIKRPENINWIFALATALIFLIVAVICHLQLTLVETNLSELKTDIDSLRSQEEIDDVVGYGLIAESFAYGFGTFAYGLTFVFLVDIPIIISAVITIFAVLLRIVYSVKNPKRVKAYRIIAVFHYLFVILSIFGYTCMFLTSGEIIFIIPTVILDLLIARMLIISIRNTYSKDFIQNIDNSEEEHEKKKNER